MKKFMILLLAAVLILTGCGTGQPQETTSASPETAVPQTTAAPV